ncbi:MAG TPA: MBOAT family O-acyltransferase, partial [Leptolinea sp.]
MRIEIILLLFPIALAIRILAKTTGYRELISLVSVLAIYMLQPEIPIRYLSFWLPTMTIAIIIFSWILVTPKVDRKSKESVHFIHRLGLLILAIGVTRYIDQGDLNIFTRPPQIQIIAVGLILMALIGLHLSNIPEGKASGFSSVALVGFLFLIFIILKNQTLSLFAGQTLRQWAGQSPALSSSLDLRWFGYSYIAFRLIHTLRDFQNKRLPAVSLQAYFNYVLFFPTLSAGPIDRLDRFIKDYDRVGENADIGGDVLIGGKRLAFGLFKKFFLADALAVIALNSTNSSQITSTRWMWVLLYAYAFQIYFDFSGYSDIAIGLAKILGINVPENFNRPYLKPNITQFWNSWHMTLTQWVRTYLFNPLTRAMRTSKFWNVPIMVIFIGQMATMVFIGLWHGITINFLIWGLWHGLGLFIQNRWSNQMRGFHDRIVNKP